MEPSKTDSPTRERLLRRHTAVTDWARSHVINTASETFPRTITWGPALPDPTSYALTGTVPAYPDSPATPILALLSYGGHLADLLHHAAPIGVHIADNHDRITRRLRDALAHRAVLVVIPTPRVLAAHEQIIFTERAEGRSMAGRVLEQPHRTGEFAALAWAAVAPLHRVGIPQRLTEAAPLTDRNSIDAAFARVTDIRIARRIDRGTGIGWPTVSPLGAVRAQLARVAVRARLVPRATTRRTPAHGGLDPAHVALEGRPILTRPRPCLAGPNEDLATLISRVTQHLIGSHVGTATASTATTDLNLWLTSARGPLTQTGTSSDVALRDVLRLWALDTVTTVTAHLAPPPAVPVLTSAQRGFAERAVGALAIAEAITHGLLDNTPPRAILADALTRVTQTCRA